MEVINVRFVSEGKAGRIYVGALPTLSPTGDRQVVMCCQKRKNGKVTWEPASPMMEMMYTLQFTI